jgi:hypothetical protein
MQGSVVCIELSVSTGTAQVGLSATINALKDSNDCSCSHAAAISRCGKRDVQRERPEPIRVAQLIIGSSTITVQLTECICRLCQIEITMLRRYYKVDYFLTRLSEILDTTFSRNCLKRLQFILQIPVHQSWKTFRCM